ncbi:MAG: substrate-binding domain-containing protein [Salinibacterium sp.]|nr:substrate-binding domain-containing protein [Salinibacterium sp.]
MKSRLVRLAAIAVVAIVASTGLVACTAGSDAVKIALLLPESKTARYEAFDRPFFEKRVSELGNYDVLYSNADQDAAKQQSQAEAALASGVRVLVLDPVDSSAAASIVAAANAQGVPVIAYDRIVNGGKLAYYVSFDNRNIGELQGKALVAKLDADGASGGILMVNGSPTDGNAGEFKSGALSQIEPSNYPVLADFDSPDWSPDKAQDWVAGQIVQFGGRIAGVYAANDGTAGGAIAALKAANVSPLPIVTGQDAELAGIQRIVSGDQYMTIYKAMKAQATLAAEVAVKLAKGEPVTGDIEINGAPATLLSAVVVTVDNIMNTVVADGIYTVAEICTPEYAAACAAAGIR